MSRRYSNNSYDNNYYEGDNHQQQGGGPYRPSNSGYGTQRMYNPAPRPPLPSHRRDWHPPPAATANYQQQQQQQQQQYQYHSPVREDPPTPPRRRYRSPSPYRESQPPPDMMPNSILRPSVYAPTSPVEGEDECCVISVDEFANNIRTRQNNKDDQFKNMEILKRLASNDNNNNPSSRRNSFYSNSPEPMDRNINEPSQHRSDNDSYYSNSPMDSDIEYDSRRSSSNQRPVERTSSDKRRKSVVNDRNKDSVIEKHRTGLTAHLNRFTQCLSPNLAVKLTDDDIHKLVERIVTDMKEIKNEFSKQCSQQHKEERMYFKNRTDKIREHKTQRQQLVKQKKSKQELEQFDRACEKEIQGLDKKFISVMDNCIVKQQTALVHELKLPFFEVSFLDEDNELYAMLLAAIRQYIDIPH